MKKLIVGSGVCMTKNNDRRLLVVGGYGTVVRYPGGCGGTFPYALRHPTWVCVCVCVCACIPIATANQTIFLRRNHFNLQQHIFCFSAAVWRQRMSGQKLAKKGLAVSPNR